MKVNKQILNQMNPSKDQIDPDSKEKIKEKPDPIENKISESEKNIKRAILLKKSNRLQDNSTAREKEYETVSPAL